MGWRYPHPRDTLRPGIAEDWRAWDGLEPVRLEKRVVYFAPDGARPPARTLEDGDQTGIQAAKRRNLTKRELSASQGAYTGNDLVWLIPDDLLPDGWTIKPGDAVVDEKDQRRWTALEVAQNRLGHTWRLTCRDLVLHLDLNDTIDLERPELTYDAAGVPAKAWSVLHASVVCRVQPQTRQYMHERGIEGFRERYDVTVEKELHPMLEDRIRWRDVYLEIVGYRSAEQIDMLPVLECERLP